MNESQKKYLSAIEELSKFLATDFETKYSHNDLESMYKTLIATKKFLDESWSEIEDIEYCGWIKEARQDVGFKQYVKLRMEIDKWEVLGR